MNTMDDIRQRAAVWVRPTYADRDRLLAAVDAVLSLHKREPMTFAEGANCAECEAEWPCPTVAAVNDALEVGK